MYFKQLYLGCLSHASYLIGDETTGEAVVVDPQRDIDGYLEETTSAGLTIKHVFLTHFHADFVSGHLELKARTGAEIRIGAKARTEYGVTPMEDGDELKVGQVQLRVLETPGHIPESICLLVFDTARDKEKPYAVLTGDTLFIGDVGRPDLMARAGVSARNLAACLYDSLHKKLLTLPDDTLVYPAHGAGSMCGKNLGNETCSTIGAQKKFNYALKPMTKEEFIKLVTADQPHMPAYFSLNAELNRQSRSTLEETLHHVLKPLSLGEALALVDKGAQLLDTRLADSYAACHLSGSINIGLSGRYATWAGTLLNSRRPIVLVTDPGAERESALRLGRIGFDNIAGYLEGGTKSLPEDSSLSRGHERISARQLAASLNADTPLVVLDVRATSEWQLGHIQGSIHIPLPELAARASELPRDRQVVTHCAGGYRSSMAVGILEQNGLANLADLAGGMAAWQKEGLPVAQETVLA